MIDRLPITRRHLGIGYIVSIGAVFTLILVTRLILMPPIETLVPVITGGILTTGLIYTGVWLFRSPLTDLHVWKVSQYGALGVALPTTAAFVGWIFLPLTVRGQANILITLIAAGGVVGSLIGSVAVLSAEHLRARRLNNRNRVLHQILRDNIRTGLNVIGGHADVLEANLQGTQATLARSIQRHANLIADLSETARSIDLTSAPDHRTLDVVPVIKRVTRSIEDFHPHVELAIDLPEHEWIQAGEFLELVLWHLLENAIEHNPSSPPTVEVTLERQTNHVALRIVDNGPGIPEEVVGALDAEGETELRELDGVGLWLAKWFVEHANGHLTVTESGPTGTTVEVLFEPAVPPSDELVPNVTLQRR